MMMVASAELDRIRFAGNLPNRMRMNAVFRTAIALIASALLLIGCRQHVAVAQGDPNGPVQLGIPEHGAYTGAVMAFGDAEDAAPLETREDWEEMVGKHRATIASRSQWAAHSL